MPVCPLFNLNDNFLKNFRLSFSTHFLNYFQLIEVLWFTIMLMIDSQPYNYNTTPITNVPFFLPRYPKTLLSKYLLNSIGWIHSPAACVVFDLLLWLCIMYCYGYVFQSVLHSIFDKVIHFIIAVFWLFYKFHIRQLSASSWANSSLFKFYFIY